MTTQTRETLKGFFQTGKQPTQSNFADLIDTIPVDPADIGAEAAGMAAAAVSAHETTHDHAQLPTADEKRGLAAYQAALAVAEAGQVLTAGGNADAAFVSPASSSSSAPPAIITEVFPYTDNLDGITAIAMNKYTVLRYQLGASRQAAMVSFGGAVSTPAPTGVALVKDGLSLGVGYIEHYHSPMVNRTPATSILVFQDYTKCAVSAMFTMYEYPNEGTYIRGKVSPLYADEGLLLGWYSTGNNSVLSAASGNKFVIEAGWLEGPILCIAVRCHATSGGPFSLGGFTANNDVYVRYFS